MHRWTWWFGLTLGGLLIVAGIAETVRLVRTGDGGLWFWFPTLGRALTTVGAIAAILPTMWTVVVPALLVVLIVVNAKQAAAAVRADTRPP